MVLRTFASSFVVVAILCGAGYVAQVYYQSQQSTKSFQQAVAEPKVNHAEAEEDKLRTASTQAKEDNVLAGIISDKISTLPRGQQWAVYVRDFQNNRMASVSADETHEPGGLYKLFLLPALENKVSADLWGGWKTKINKKPVKYCVDLMIRTADSVCDEAVGAFVGLEYADQVNQSLGFQKTKLSLAFNQQTTAREVGDLIYRLQTSQLLSDKARRYLFDSLYEQTSVDGIPAGCGIGCLIANKTGEKGDIYNDAAVVTDGTSKYIVVIMSKGASWQAVAEVQRAINSAMQP